MIPNVLPTIFQGKEVLLKGIGYKVPTMSDKDIAKVTETEEYIKTLEPVALETYHTLYEGVYYRTMVLNPGNMATSVIIKVPTTLTIFGNVAFTLGDKVYRIKGFFQAIAEPYRKQLALAKERTYIVMSFKTDAKTLEEAEEEFTDETHRLASRLPNAINHYQGDLK